MPRIRKLSDEEVSAIESSEPLLAYGRNRAELALVIDEGLESPEMGTPGYIATPRLGDIVRVADGATGVVLRVYCRDDIWTAAELLVGEQRRCVSAASIVESNGRLRGISRIDQPSHHTHGWYVRIGYDASGKHARVSRFFSDRTYGGAAAALLAARLFHSAETKRA